MLFLPLGSLRPGPGTIITIIRDRVLA